MSSSKTSSKPRGAPPPPTDPYATLELGRDADDAAVKRAYFLLVRRHPPETDPERFQVIRAAYDKLRTAEGRARASLFLLQPPPPLPRQRRPSYDLAVHRSDLLRLGLELRLAQLPIKNDFHEPTLPSS
jgi:curved DNA-binding protein CbpA